MIPGKNRDMDDYGQREALKVNDVLFAKGYSATQATEWWNASNAQLNGATPLQLWLSVEIVTEEIIEVVFSAAIAADLPR